MLPPTEPIHPMYLSVIAKILDKYFVRRPSFYMWTCYYLCTGLVLNRLIGPVGRVFGNHPGDLVSIPGHVIPMVLDTSLLNTQQYKVRIEGKVEQSREMSSALLYTSV